jgi:hypothetical protein
LPPWTEKKGDALAHIAFALLCKIFEFMVK